MPIVHAIGPTCLAGCTSNGDEISPRTSSPTIRDACEGPEGFARFLRLPCRALGSSTHVEPDREHICDPASSNRADQGRAIGEDRKFIVFKLVNAAAKTWRRLNGENQLPKVVQGVHILITDFNRNSRATVTCIGGVTRHQRRRALARPSASFLRWSSIACGAQTAWWKFSFNNPQVGHDPHDHRTMSSGSRPPSSPLTAVPPAA